MNVATAMSTGSASVQGDLWARRAHDYAEVQEPAFLPLYESVLERPEMARVAECHFAVHLWPFILSRPPLEAASEAVQRDWNVGIPGYVLPEGIGDRSLVDVSAVAEAHGRRSWCDSPSLAAFHGIARFRRSSLGI